MRARLRRLRHHWSPQQRTTRRFKKMLHTHRPVRLTDGDTGRVVWVKR